LIDPSALKACLDHVEGDGAGEASTQWVMSPCEVRKAWSFRRAAMELRADRALRPSDERWQTDEHGNRDAQCETYRNQSNRNEQSETGSRQSPDGVFRKE